MRRGLYKTRAVVLNSFDYGESDRILSFWTENYGKVSAIAKGARRSRKRFVGNLEPGCDIKLVFFSGGRSALGRVEESTLLDGFVTLRSDVDSFARACYLLELTSEMTREGLVLKRVYTLLRDTLRLLEANGEEMDVFVRFFEIRLLSVLGYMPFLGGCVVCKAPVSTGHRRVYFSSERGGLVCGSCAPAGLLPISAGTAAFLSMAERFDAEKLRRLRPGTDFLRESEAVLEDFIRHQLGHELRTRKFMEKMKRADFDMGISWAPAPAPAPVAALGLDKKAGLV